MILKKIAYFPYLLFKIFQHVKETQCLERKGIRLLYWNFLKSKKKSDTLVILGSGRSINEISKDHWDQFERFDTIGFNFWPLHSFIPDIYLFETPRDKIRLEAFKKLNSFITEQYNDTLLIYKDIKFLNESKFRDSVLHQGYYLPFLSIPGSTLSLFTSALSMIALFNKFNLFENVHFWKRASVINLILLGIKLKYSRIILCGIDLMNTHYFYETDFAKNPLVSHDLVKSLVDENLRINRNSSMHKINNNLHGSLIAEDLIKVISGHRISKSARLMVYNKSSALSKFLPSYFEK